MAARESRETNIVSDNHSMWVLIRSHIDCLDIRRKDRCMPDESTYDIDIEHLRAWVGREDSKDDVVSESLLQRFNAGF